MERLNRLLEAAGHWNFSILGSVYIAPGFFVRMEPVQYLALMLAGLVWVIAVPTCVFLLLRRHWGPWRRLTDSSIALKTGLAFLAVYFLLGAYVTLLYPPTTDEPHYLALAQGLVGEGDLDLADNYARRDYRLFYPGETIDPHAVITPEGRWYSQHNAGLPLMLLPAYALGGRWGILALLSALSSVLVALLFLICRKSGADPPSAVAASALTGATLPLFPASTLVFTEAPAALGIAASVLSLGRGALAPIAASLLPWLHPRYALIALGLALLDIYASDRRLRRLAVWIGLGGASGIVFLSLYYGPALTSILNVLTERYPARIEDLTAGNLAAVSFGNPLRGILAKLFDRDFGWFPFSPWAMVLVPGAMASLFMPKFPHALFIAGALPYLALSCLFRNWGPPSPEGPWCPCFRSWSLTWQSGPPGSPAPPLAGSFLPFSSRSAWPRPP